MSLLKMRDYQEAGVRAVVAAWQGGTQRTAVVWPTGAGKTVGFAHLAQRILARGGRVPILVHRDELAQQAVEKLRAVMPDEPVGMWKAERRELHGRRVVVVSIQSAWRDAAVAEFAKWRPTAVVVDECHHAVASSYMRFLEGVGCFAQEEDGSPRCYAVGFTATLVRGDGLALDQAWQSVAHRVDILDMIRRGYLLLPRGLRVFIPDLDLSGVRRSGGDYQDGSLGDALMEHMAPRAIAAAYREHASDRQGIVFMPTVQTAYVMAEELEAAGITAACVEGTLEPEDRRLIMKRIRAGEIQVLTNCMVLTEGTDLPMVSCVVPRLTTSAGLYVQMAGRGLRPHPGQDDALIMDCVGVGARHKLATLATLTGSKRVQELADALTDAELAELDLLGLAGLEEIEADRTGAGSMAPDMRDGQTQAYEFALFEESHRTWLRTERGVWFIIAGTGSEAHVIYVVPELDNPGFCRLASVPVRARGGKWLIEEPTELSYAMARGEQTASEIGGFTQRKASWRRQEVTDKQLRVLGMSREQANGMKAGDAGDLISVRTATARIDGLPMLAHVKKG